MEPSEPHTPATSAVRDVSDFLRVADHTLLAPETTPNELREFLRGARELSVSRVCVSPAWLPLEPAEQGELEVVTVVGFPTGSHAADAKAAEARIAVASGAHEIDMVVNPALVRAGLWAAVEHEVAAVRVACPGLVLKVILETARLTDDEIVGCCTAAVAAGADFVKTSTGFHAAGGASVHAVRLMAATVGDRAGVKASGGVRSAAAVRELAAAGATRFGVSGTAAIVAEWVTSSHDAATGGVGAETGVDATPEPGNAVSSPGEY